MVQCSRKFLKNTVEQSRRRRDEKDVAGWIALRLEEAEAEAKAEEAVEEEKGAEAAVVEEQGASGKTE